MPDPHLTQISSSREGEGVTVADQINTEEEREKFEAWARSSNLPDTYDLSRSAHGTYNKVLVGMAWCGWEARAKREAFERALLSASQPVAGQPVASLDSLHQLAKDCGSFCGNGAHVGFSEQAWSKFVTALSQPSAGTAEGAEGVRRYARSDYADGLDDGKAQALNVLEAFEQKQRGLPQAHIAAALVAELRAALVSAPSPCAEGERGTANQEGGK